MDENAPSLGPTNLVGGITHEEVNSRSTRASLAAGTQEGRFAFGQVYKIKGFPVFVVPLPHDVDYVRRGIVERFVEETGSHRTDPTIAMGAHLLTTIHFAVY